MTILCPVGGNTCIRLVVRKRHRHPMWIAPYRLRLFELCDTRGILWQTVVIALIGIGSRGS